MDHLYFYDPGGTQKNILTFQVILVTKVLSDPNHFVHCSPKERD